MVQTKTINKGADDNFVTDAEKTVIGNTSGMNTGDEVLATGAELDTGTDDVKYASAKAIKDSHNVPSVVPGTDGNVLTSNGTDWTSEAPSGGGDVGGVYGINAETLTANKTLTAGTDEIYQWLDPGALWRVITLDTASASAGDRFVIKFTGDYDSDWFLRVAVAGVELDEIRPGSIKHYIFDGTNWTAVTIGTGENSNLDKVITIGREANGEEAGIAIGYKARGNVKSVGIGYSADASNDAVAIGYESEASFPSVAVGQYAVAKVNGVAIGNRAKVEKYFAVALGEYAEAYRASEICHNINGDDTDQENNITIGGWAINTANATPTEMFCGGHSTDRFTIRPNSILVFTMLVSARDNVSGDCASYKVEGAIKRDGSNNTAMLAAAIITVIHEDDASWDIAVTADDTNESLKIEVTGDASNIVQWAARLDGVETHF